MPPQFDAGPRHRAPAPRWEALFDGGGPDDGGVHAGGAAWTPRDFADTRAAWEGPLPDGPDLASASKRPPIAAGRSSFLMVGPWSVPDADAAAAARRPRTRRSWRRVTVLVVVLVARRRCCSRATTCAPTAPTSAARCGSRCIVLAATPLPGSSARTTCPTSTGDRQFLESHAASRGRRRLLWVIYIALEPYVRRFWPDGILGWTRLISGYVRDPRVGRDVLTGCVFGVAMGCCWTIFYELLPPLLGRPPPIPRYRERRRRAEVGAFRSREIFDAHRQRAVRGDVRGARLRPAAADLPADAGDVAAALWCSRCSRRRVLTSGTSMWIGVVFQAS